MWWRTSECWHYCRLSLMRGRLWLNKYKSLGSRMEISAENGRRVFCWKWSENKDNDVPSLTDSTKFVFIFMYNDATRYARQQIINLIQIRLTLTQAARILECIKGSLSSTNKSQIHFLRLLFVVCFCFLYSALKYEWRYIRFSLYSVLIFHDAFRAKSLYRVHLLEPYNVSLML